MGYENKIEYSVPDNSKLKKQENFENERRAENDKLFDKALVDVHKLKKGIGDKGAVEHMKDVDIEKLEPEDYEAFINTFLSDRWYENWSEFSEYDQSIQRYIQAKLAVDSKYDTFSDSRNNFYGMIRNKLITKNREMMNKQNGNKS
jgi:hypothetical protein